MRLWTLSIKKKGRTIHKVPDISYTKCWEIVDKYKKKYDKKHKLLYILTPKEVID